VAASGKVRSTAAHAAVALKVLFQNRGELGKAKEKVRELLGKEKQGPAKCSRIASFGLAEG